MIATPNTGSNSLPEAQEGHGLVPGTVFRTDSGSGDENGSRGPKTGSNSLPEAFTGWVLRGFSLFRAESESGDENGLGGRQIRFFAEF